MRFDPDSKKLIANEKNLSSSKESLNKLTQEENKDSEKNEQTFKSDNRLSEQKKETSIKEKTVLRDVRNSLDFEEKKDEKRDAEKDVSDGRYSSPVGLITGRLAKKVKMILLTICSEFQKKVHGEFQP